MSCCRRNDGSVASLSCGNVWVLLFRFLSVDFRLWLKTTWFGGQSWGRGLGSFLWVFGLGRRVNLCLRHPPVGLLGGRGGGLVLSPQIPVSQFYLCTKSFCPKIKYLLYIL
jgi:hypothetical protein